MHRTIRFILPGGFGRAPAYNNVMKKHVYKTVAFTEIAVKARDNKTYLELSNH